MVCPVQERGQQASVSLKRKLIVLQEIESRSQFQKKFISRRRGHRLYLLQVSCSDVGHADSQIRTDISPMGRADDAIKRTRACDWLTGYMCGNSPTLLTAVVGARCRVEETPALSRRQDSTSIPELQWTNVPYDLSLEMVFRVC